MSLSVHPAWDAEDGSTKAIEMIRKKYGSGAVAPPPIENRNSLQDWEQNDRINQLVQKYLVGREDTKPGSNRVRFAETDEIFDKLRIPHLSSLGTTYQYRKNYQESWQTTPPYNNKDTATDSLLDKLRQLRAAASEDDPLRASLARRPRSPRTSSPTHFSPNSTAPTTKNQPPMTTAALLAHLATHHKAQSKANSNPLAPSLTQLRASSNPDRGWGSTHAHLKAVYHADIKLVRAEVRQRAQDRERWTVQKALVCWMSEGMDRQADDEDSEGFHAGDAHVPMAEKITMDLGLPKYQKPKDHQVPQGNKQLEEGFKAGHRPGHSAGRGSQGEEMIGFLSYSKDAGSDMEDLSDRAADSKRRIPPGNEILIEGADLPELELPKYDDNGMTELQLKGSSSREPEDSQFSRIPNEESSRFSKLSELRKKLTSIEADLFKSKSSRPDRPN